MEWTCSDIYMLLQREPAAREYYNSLPRYVKDRLDYASDGVTTVPRLVQRAQETARADLIGSTPFGVL